MAGGTGGVRPPRRRARVPRAATTRRSTADRSDAPAPAPEERYRAVSELISDWAYAFRVEPHGSLVREWISDAFTRSSGYASGEIDAKGGWPSLIHPDDLSIARRQNQRLLAGHDDVAEFRIITKQGESRWLRNYCRPVWDAEQQRTVRIYGAAQDITELKRTIGELSEWKQRYDVAVLASGQILYDWNSATDEVRFAGNVEPILGYRTDEAPHDLTGALDMTHPEDRDRFLAEIVRVRQTGEPFHLEYRVRRADGSYIAVEDRGYFHPDGRGVLHMVGFIVDITERQRAEAEKAALLEIAKDITGTLDLDELLARIGRRTAEALGCEAVLTFYWDQVEQIFRTISHHGVPADLIAGVAALRFSPGRVFGGRLTGGQTIVINNVVDQPWLPRELYERFQFFALVAAPLIVRGRMLGALVAISRKAGRRFLPDQVQLFESIARQLAVAIEATELYMAQQDEADVSGALARVGRELISSLDAPVLLDRLCGLTAEVLGCDCSHAFLWDADAQVFLPISGFGDTAEQWESLRVLRIPRALAAGLLDRLERDDFAQVVMDQPQRLLPTALSLQFGITQGLYVALRRGGDVVGILTAGYRGRTQPFSAKQGRMAHGIAQVASLALENARLVEALEQANRLKADFVATMSHELRTPLHVILGYNDLLLEHMFGPLQAEQEQTLERMHARASELLDLVNTTLDLSRLEAGRVPLDLKAVDVGELIREIDAETPLVREKPGVAITWEIAAGLPGLVTDPLKLKVIVKNLLINAVKFTDAGRITIAAHGRDGGIEISVADTGIGIPPEEHPFIFEPFRQAHHSRARTVGGVGLGLYIVRRLLDVLGGSIALESAPGRGSCFRVWVPLRHDR